MLQYCAHPEPHEEYCVQLVPHPEEHDVLPEQRFTPQDTATPHIVEQLPSLHLPKQLPYSLKQTFKLYYEVHYDYFNRVFWLTNTNRRR